ncbi:MAG TPA: CoB--CoM heterodisulfide reductase iron-sulfur subunit B family protein [Anaerolineales bacterium]|nr:CoB--CoM heterodisulfide reductase iron-sulfur subunit B family protein [Anaerolineales bacterium]
MRDYLLYPGCSMEYSARAYQDSLSAISETLGLQLTEIEDWNCCGATEYLGVSVTPAYALIARNLALAAEMDPGKGRELVAPCSACYLNLVKADHNMHEEPGLERRVNEALAAGKLHYDPGSLSIRHLLDVVVNDVGLAEVERHVVQPLTGLRLVPYVGCMVPRPDYNGRISDHDRPTELDDLLRVLGADVVDYPLKTECCGGHMPQIGPEMGFELIRRLIAEADQLEGDAMVTLCPMCQLNLDAYQGEMNQFFNTKYHMPVLFFTQLMGLAFGLDAKSLGFGLELVSARNVLEALGVKPPVDTPPAPPKRPRKPEGLPMPAPLPRLVEPHSAKEVVR